MKNNKKINKSCTALKRDGNKCTNKITNKNNRTCNIKSHISDEKQKKIKKDFEKRKNIKRCVKIKH